MIKVDHFYLLIASIDPLNLKFTFCKILFMIKAHDLNLVERTFKLRVFNFCLFHTLIVLAVLQVLKVNQDLEQFRSLEARLN